MNAVEQQSHDANVIHLCTYVIDACSLTDIETLKQKARLILRSMGIEAPEPEDDWRDLL